MELIFLGPGGAGKGTQARLLEARMGLPQIATGDILREAVAAETPLGRQAKEYMRAGDLVPDEIMIGIVEERIRRPDAQAGFVLDGFPRTLPQAEALEETLLRLRRPLDRVIEFVLNQELLIRRLSGRMVCRLEGHIYHEEFKRPRRPGICDVDKSPLYHRDDDRPEAVRHRMEVYRTQTAPVLDFYRARGVYAALDADGDVEEIYARVLALLPPDTMAGSAASA